MMAIVTDSTICIPRAEAEALGLHIVSNSYSINGQAYLEGFSDENGEFEQQIFADPENCKTSQAPVSGFIETFRDLIAQGMEVLCLVISSRLSGTFSSACIAAQEVDKQKIIVVDSLSTSGGLWLLAKRARMLAEKGLPLRQVAAALLQLRDKAGIVFSVNDMAALRRSGRLGVVPQSVGTVLNIRPILMCLRGAIVARGVARGNAERVRSLSSKVPSDAKEIVVHHMGERSSVQPLYESIRQRFPDAQIHVSKLGPVLSVHLGAGTVGVSWISE